MRATPAPVLAAESVPAPRHAASLRSTLLGGLSALLVLAACLLYFAARSYGAQAADRSYDQLLQSSALSMADSVAYVQGQWQVDLPYAALDLLAMAPQDRAFYRIQAPGGQTITGYADLPAAERDATAAARPEANTPYFFDADYRGSRLRFVQVPRYIVAEAGVGSATAPVWVQVGQTRLARQALADEIFWRIAAVVGGLLLATFALLTVVVLWALRPLARLQHELAGREAGDLRPLRSAVPRELDPLVVALNDFMARLAVNLEALRTLIAEAAHQMRTPLAALIAQAQDGLDDGQPAQLRRSLQVVERNAMRLRRLLNQLLSDASVAHQGHLRQFEPLDLMRVLHDAARDVLPRAEPQVELQIDWAGAAQSGLPDAAEQQQAWVQGDALMLREAFKNLIDNALKYGRPERGPLRLSLRSSAEGRSWQLELWDHGPGVPEAYRKRVFERFVRVPAAAAERPEGAGLGLAIVRRVLDSHGGQIQLLPRGDGQPGLCVQVRLPQACPLEGAPCHD
jgi:two-component system sensor histidine kinase TctE